MHTQGRAWNQVLCFNDSWQKWWKHFLSFGVVKAEVSASLGHTRSVVPDPLRPSFTEWLKTGITNYHPSGKLVTSTLLYSHGGGGDTTVGCPRTDLIRGKNAPDAWSCSALSPSSQQKPSTADGAGPRGQISIYLWHHSCLMLQQVYSTYLLYLFSGQMLRTSQCPPLQARCSHDAIMD